MGRRLIFMNVKKKCKRIHYFTEKAFREKNLHKIASLCDKNPKIFWTSVKTLLRDTLQQNVNCIYPNIWKPYFNARLNNFRYNSDKFVSDKDKLIHLETNMLGKRGPLDDIFTEKELIEAMKSLKLNKSKFGVISNEMLKCNPQAIFIYY